MISWGDYSFSHDSYRFPGLCASLGADIVLRGYRNYKFIFGYSLCRRGYRILVVGWLCCRGAYIIPIFWSTLSDTFFGYSLSFNSFSLSPSDRFFQPSRSSDKFRQDFFSPLFCMKRFDRFYYFSSRSFYVSDN